MPKSVIDLRQLRTAVNAILDHVIEDLGIEAVPIEEGHDHYWECSDAEAYVMSKQPAQLDVGRLSDDADFTRLVRRGEAGDVSFNLVHVAPLLRYLANTVKR
jgi:hypothetical protein